MSRNPCSVLARLAVLAALAMAAPATRADGPAAPPDATELAQQVLSAVNGYRSAHQLPPLQPDDTLQLLALEHSREMAQRARLSHAGFPVRFQRAHRQLCVENLATGYRRADALLEGWRASPPHHENLLEPRVVRVGLAQVNGWVTLFACTMAVQYEVATGG